MPLIDLMVEVELPRREMSGLSSILLAKLPHRLEPGWTDAIDLPQSLLACEFPHCHAMSCPLFPLSARSLRCRGGGSGGGTGSRECGIDIGMEAVEGEEVELNELEELDVRNRSEGLGSWT